MTDLQKAIQDLLLQPDVCPEARDLIQAALRTQGGSTSLEDEAKALALPKAEALSKRLLAHQLYAGGKGYKAISSLLEVSRGTVQTWKKRGQWRRSASPHTQEVVFPPALVWCSSMAHESYHLVDPVTQLAWCNASVGRFGIWSMQPTPEQRKKCTRCMAKERS